MPDKIIIKFSLQNKIIASTIGFVVIIFCLIYFIIIPSISEIKTMGQEIESQRIDLEKKYIKGQSLRRLTENLSIIEPKLNLLDQIFINQKRELAFITTLEAKAGNSQIKQKINLGQPQSAANQLFQKSSLQLFAKGDFNSLLKYLNEIEKLNYYVNIKSLELTPADDGAAAPAPAGEPVPEKDLSLFGQAEIYWE